MICIDPAGEWELLVQADHDGELAPADSARVQTHLHACAHCAAWRDALGGLSAQLRAEPAQHTAPPALRRSAMRLAAGAPRRIAAPLASFGLGATLAASLLLMLLPGTPEPANALVASHIRATQPGHMIDVASTDRHTVKPWFEGRIDFAPPVRNLAAQGYTLIGGRLDYVGDRPVAVLVYRHGKHDIDLYIWPSTRIAAPSAQSMRGFAVVSWAADGMELRAIADSDTADLLALARVWATAPEDTTGQP
jgi:anti-sigma factor RsiW